MNVGVHVSAHSVSGAVLCVQVYKQMMKRIWELPTKLVTPGVWIGDSRGPWHKSDTLHVPTFWGQVPRVSNGLNRLLAFHATCFMSPEHRA